MGFKCTEKWQNMQFYAEKLEFNFRQAGTDEAGTGIMANLQILTKILPKFACFGNTFSCI
jgi:hypothetical protein